MAQANTMHRGGMDFFALARGGEMTMKIFCEILAKKVYHIKYVKSHDRLSQVLVENSTKIFKLNF